MFDNPDINDWLGHHADENVNGVLRFNQPCMRLQHGRCGIYGNRPQMCRDYEAGSDACLKAIDKFRPEMKTELLQLINQSQQAGWPKE